MHYGAFWAKIKASGGNNLKDFPQNQLTKFRAVETIKAIQTVR